jgi:hypothetical protein
MQKKPGAQSHDEFSNGLETKSVNNANRPDNIRQPPGRASSSSVPPANIDSDDKLLDDLFSNRLGLDLPDFK